MSLVRIVLLLQILISTPDYFIDFVTKMQNKYFPIHTKVWYKKRYGSPWIHSDVL